MGPSVKSPPKEQEQTTRKNGAKRVKKGNENTKNVTKQTTVITHASTPQTSKAKPKPKSNNLESSSKVSSNKSVKSAVKRPKSHTNTKNRVSPVKVPNVTLKAIPKELPIKISLNTLELQRNHPEQLSKNLVNILQTLKKEYDYIDDNAGLASPSLKTMQNPVMLLRNKAIGPINKSEKPDGVVNLDELLKIRKNNVQLAAQSKSYMSWSDRSEAVKVRLDEIIKKHTTALDNLEAKRKIVDKPKETNAWNQLPDVTVHNVPADQQAIKPKQSIVKTTTPRYTILPTNQKPAPRMSFSAISQRTVSHTGQMFRDEIKLFRDKVNAAIKANKTFTVYGNYYSIRNALHSRGWVERLHPNYMPPAQSCDLNLFRRLQTLSIPELEMGIKDKELGHIYKSLITSKMIGAQAVAFYWDLNRETFRTNAENLKNVYINFISKSRFNYANKQGLCECAKQAYWFNNPGVSFLRTPRSYSLNGSGASDDFIADFKITAAMAFLKWILHTYENKSSKLISETGKIPIIAFQFALRECAKFVKSLKHEDIDVDLPAAAEREWQEFLDCFYKAVHVGNHFKSSGLETDMSMVHKSKAMVKKLKEVFQQIDSDGFMNIWILKPSYGSRGLGIHFCRTLQYVLKVIKENTQNSYVIQKYIERPLLIHNTKFDIRQWFLISSTSPLTIWIYKECYLRFSSQTYNLRKLHESIHLTNNSVQSKYQNGNRDPCLPVHNMWFLRDFKQHLESVGYPDVYNRIIYPGMKECIVAALLTNLDQIYRTTKAFELHGADFMITEDFQPWLIEINSKPALNPSTPVTSKLCPAVLEDLIKVIVDHPNNPKASTGSFELMYRETPVEYAKKIENGTFMVHGKPIDPNYFLTPEQVQVLEDGVEKKSSSDSINVITSTDYMKFVAKEMKKTLQQLLNVIEKERMRRQNSKSSRSLATESAIVTTYGEDIEKLKTNVKEIKEIFKQETLKATTSDDSVAVKGEILDSISQMNSMQDVTDSLLNVNCKKIENVLDSFITNKKTDSKVINNMLKIIDSINVTKA